MALSLRPTIWARSDDPTRATQSTDKSRAGTPQDQKDPSLLRDEFAHSHTRSLQQLREDTASV